MPIRVVSFSTYLTTIDGWRPVDYDAHDFIDAIKDREITGYSHVPLRGRSYRFNNDNRQEVVVWFAKMVSDYFAAKRIKQPITLVPVPGSKVDLSFIGKPRTAQLAQAIAQTRSGTTKVRDVLRWREAMPSANEQGGTRDPAELLDNLELMGKMKGLRVVLVDDVITTGGHLQACAAKLRHAGAQVLMAICAGRADGEQVADPFAVRQEVIDDFLP